MIAAYTPLTSTRGSHWYCLHFARLYQAVGWSAIFRRPRNIDFFNRITQSHFVGSGSARPCWSVIQNGRCVAADFCDDDRNARALRVTLNRPLPRVQSCFIVLPLAIRFMTSQSSICLYTKPRQRIQPFCTNSTRSQGRGLNLRVRPFLQRWITHARRRATSRHTIILLTPRIFRFQGVKFHLWTFCRFSLVDYVVDTHCFPNRFHRYFRLPVFPFLVYVSMQSLFLRINNPNCFNGMQSLEL